MAAPRVSSFKVLRALSQHRRHLHITGVNSAPAVTSSEKASSLWLSKTTEDLAGECRRRGLKAVGDKSELIERVTAHDMLQSRAYSIALKRINAAKTDDSVSTSRSFNTSRALKAPGDNSTVDFAFLPTNLDHAIHDSSFNMRVPILPDAYHVGAVATNPIVAAQPTPVMKPEVYSVSGSQDIRAPSPIIEVLESTSMDVDPASLAETVSRAAAKMVEEGKQEAGSLKGVWKGLVDDVFGPNHKGTLA